MCEEVCGNIRKEKQAEKSEETQQGKLREGTWAEAQKRTPEENCEEAEFWRK